MTWPTPAIIEHSSRERLPTIRPSHSATNSRKPGGAINYETNPVAASIDAGRKSLPGSDCGEGVWQMRPDSGTSAALAGRMVNTTTTFGSLVPSPDAG